MGMSVSKAGRIVIGATAAVLAAVGVAALAGTGRLHKEDPKLPVNLNETLTNEMSDTSSLLGFDLKVRQYLNLWGLQGASLSIMRNDSLLFAKGYGWADTKNTVAYHWNNETNTKYNISGPEKEVVQLTAPAKVKSFTIQRSAGTGTQISQVCFELVSSATGIENIGTKDMRCTKVLRNGQFLIFRDGKTYSIIGTRAE